MADINTAKSVLQGTEIHSFLESASGSITYTFNDTGIQGTGEDLQVAYKDDSGNPDSTKIPGILGSARQLLIGMEHFKQKSGIYQGQVWGWVSASDVTRHQLRVSDIRIACGGNPYIYNIIIALASRPKPTFETGTFGNQETLGTYILPFEVGINQEEHIEGNSGMDELNPPRKQMTLAYFAKQGSILADDGTGNPQPMEDTYFPTLPVEASGLTFGASFRFSATYYADEISPIPLTVGQPALQVRALINKMCSYYSNTVNWNDLFFKDDAGYWLLSSLTANSNDGGYTYRISGEWIFNRNGWDSTAVYSNPLTGQTAIVDISVLQDIRYPLIADQSSVPDPVIPTVDNAGVVPYGCGRWPQQRQADHKPLLKMFLQDTSTVQGDDVYKNGIGDVIQNMSVESHLDALSPLYDLGN